MKLICLFILNLKKEYNMTKKLAALIILPLLSSFCLGAEDIVKKQDFTPNYKSGLSQEIPTEWKSFEQENLETAKELLKKNAWIKDGHGEKANCFFYNGSLYISTYMNLPNYVHPIIGTIQGNLLEGEIIHEDHFYCPGKNYKFELHNGFVFSDEGYKLTLLPKNHKECYYFGKN